MLASVIAVSCRYASFRSCGIRTYVLFFVEHLLFCLLLFMGCRVERLTLRRVAVMQTSVSFGERLIPTTIVCFSYVYVLLGGRK